MKKLIYRFSIFFLILFLAFSSFPFPKVNAEDSHLNFIDFLRTNLGLVKINNGSLSSLDRADFIDSLYNTSLAWEDNGTTFSFVPANVFTRSEWYSLATTGLTPSQNLPQYDGFNLRESLILSDYIQDTGSGLDLSDFPKLENNVDTVSPLDGIEVKSNFADFSPRFSFSFRPAYSETLFNSIKNMFLSENNNLTIICGYSASSSAVYSCNFLSFLDNDTYYYFITNNSNSFSGLIRYGYRYNDSWNTSSYLSSLYNFRSTDSKDNYMHSINYNARFNHLFFTSSVPPALDLASTNNSETECSIYLQNNSTLNSPFQYWSNRPIVFASDNSAGQNYYYWMRGVPSGNYYTTSNVNQVYSYDYVTNNNWETAYNNYITDVSNYYNTTENISNEQISNYIDNSTTINNITNNYINNESGGGGGESGDNSDIIGWLKLMYDKLDDIESNTYGIDGYLEIISNQLNTIQEKLNDIFYWIAGKSTDPAEPHYTDDSITNDILKFPEENLFPNVPDEYFISSEDLEGIDSIPWELISSKIGSVISEVVPFCYLFTLTSFMELLVAPPSAPYYEIPFVIESYNINETVIIDLTGETWQVLHGIWIALFMIMFVAFLFYLTHKVLLLISNMFV